MNILPPNWLTKLQASLQALRMLWAQRTPRERQWLGTAAALVCLVLVVGLAMVPALRTWHEAPTRQAALDATSSRMQQLQAQAQALKPPAPVSLVETIRWLEATMSTDLGAAVQWRLEGAQLHVTLSDTSGEQLGAWLERVREGAQARPVQAQLQQLPLHSAGDRAPSGGHGLQGESTVRWSGRLVLTLPESP